MGSIPGSEEWRTRPCARCAEPAHRALLSCVGSRRGGSSCGHPRAARSRELWSEARRDPPALLCASAVPHRFRAFDATQTTSGVESFPAAGKLPQRESIILWAVENARNSSGVTTYKTCTPRHTAWVRVFLPCHARAHTQARDTRSSRAPRRPCENTLCPPTQSETSNKRSVSASPFPCQAPTPNAASRLFPGSISGRPISRRTAPATRPR